jgi:preprotein translocase subunit SecD
VANPGALPACGEQYRTSPTSLGLPVYSNSASGFGIITISPDPAFTIYSSTTAHDADVPSTRVLLPNDPANRVAPYPRFVLGPAQMDGHLIATVRAYFDRSIAGWTVEGTFTSSGAIQWDRTTQADFHQYLAIDMDGDVVSAPLIQPAGTTFSSFTGKLQIGNLTKSAAKQIAALLESGPLAAPLVPG